MVPAPPVLVVVGNGAGAEAGGGTRTEHPVLHEWEFVAGMSALSGGTWAVLRTKKESIGSIPLHR
jgi:hypothetical protein